MSVELEAKQLWDANNGYEAGIILCEKMPLRKQPIWAAQLLTLVAGRVALSHPLIDETLDLVKRPERWNAGHGLFDRLREVTLELDEAKTISVTEESRKFGCLIALAEQVAKVIYNASDPRDEFDEDSAAWIVAMVRGFVSVSNDKDFDISAWNAVKDV